MPARFGHAFEELPAVVVDVCLGNQLAVDCELLEVGGHVDGDPPGASVFPSPQF